MSYGCHNRPAFRAGYIVQSGHYMSGRERVDKMDWVPHTMTKDCQYTLSDLGRKDKQCEGCKWKRTE